jgi:DNA-binding HxlR family transcriptional regulator
MKRTSFRDMNCSIARALEVVGEWWTFLVLREAFLGVRRFEGFQERLGIARNVLTTRLRRLVARGVLERSRYQTRPARFEYRLTEKGLDLFPVVVALKEWGDRWIAGRRGPPVVLAERATGRRIDPVLVCRRTMRPIRARETIARPGPGATRETRRRFAEKR